MWLFQLYSAVENTAFFQWLCHRKWLMLFSLKFQMDNQQNVLAVDSVNGKQDKNCIFSVLRR